MDRMWSPWRSEHVEGFERRHRAPGEGSVFTRLAADPERDDEHLVVWRGETVFAVMNLYPYNNGHLLLVPYREVSRYSDLTPAERAELAEAIDRSMRWLRTALRPEGFNVGINEGEAGGAGIPEHLHVHVVPRWRGDTNFMPVTADVKLVPEAMQRTFERLRAAIREDQA
jgi:ATP adenylyltransferase